MNFLLKASVIMMLPPVLIFIVQEFSVPINYLEVGKDYCLKSRNIYCIYYGSEGDWSGNHGEANLPSSFFIIIHRFID